MSWITVIWSMVVSACLTLGLVHGLLWYSRRAAWANLFFATTTLSVAFLAACELWMMRTQTPEQFGEALRWFHVPGSMLVISIAWFARLYLQAGRLRLLWTICALRILALVLNFVFTPNLNFREITALRQVPFLGEAVSIAVGVINPWTLLGHVSLLLTIIFIADATFTVWRRGDRRLALFVGGSILFFSLAGTAQLVLVLRGIVHTPLTGSLFYLGIVAAMDFELSRDMLRSQQLSDDLRKSEARMTLATEAANLGIWIRDLITNDIWATEKWRELLGFSQSQAIDFDRFLRKLHPDDRESVVQRQIMAVNGAGSYETEYRVVLPDEGIRWISSRGRVEFNETGQPIRVRGVSMDITHRKLAELKVVQQRNELAHLSRVTTLGEISGSLAHELNQPLGAILANTEAVEMHLQSPTPRMDVVRQILADIRRDDLRAGEIIHGMRAFLRRREFDMQPIAFEELAREALRLVSAEAATRQITLGIIISPQLPLVLGDRTCLTQVMVNLLVNAMDAVASCIAPYRHITIQVSQGDTSAVDIAVTDAGVGIPAADINRVFEPFQTTKQGGLGLGLAICRSIIEAHGSSILISNNIDRGATARFSLSTCSA
jgi:two-component system, LuxR family, sensor kinase FixL